MGTVRYPQPLRQPILRGNYWQQRSLIALRSSYTPPITSSIFGPHRLSSLDATECDLPVLSVICRCLTRNRADIISMGSASRRSQAPIDHTAGQLSNEPKAPQ
ncbi:hypothetical protein RB195_004794 [Necator americanus]